MARDTTPMRRRLTSSEETIVGLDLSLTGTAACAIPIGWNHEMYGVRTMRTGYKLDDADSLKEIVRRWQTIVNDVIRFCRYKKAKHIFVEDYAFSQGQSRAHALGELGGIVKLKITEQTGLIVVPIVASRARKILLQKLPRSDVKSFVYRNVRRLEGPSLSWTDDEVDSFVITNAGIMLSGGVAMSFPGR